MYQIHSGEAEVHTCRKKEESGKGVLIYDKKVESAYMHIQWKPMGMAC